ncbi:MAG: PHP domain-containing protein, partial [Syntrophomonas sp.]
MRVDYHVHVLAHGEYNYNLQWVNQYIDAAYQKGIREIGFSEHDEYTNQVVFELFKEMQARRRHDISLKMGVEMDYIPGQEEIIKDIIAQREYDYVIGSVHYLDGWGFDHPDFKRGFDHR